MLASVVGIRRAKGARGTRMVGYATTLCTMLALGRAQTTQASKSDLFFDFL